MSPNQLKVIVSVAVYIQHGSVSGPKKLLHLTAEEERELARFVISVSVLVS